MATRGRPVAIDLFAGVGGFSLGFEQAGFDVVAAVELDPIHAATHHLNFPNSAVICEDVRKLTGEDIRSKAGFGRRAIDVVIGGPPCQGFSLIGQRLLRDPRNELVFHFMRLVLELRPRTFVMENVPGMAIRKHSRFVIELIENFRAGGYRVRIPYRTLNAGNFGVPQNRERVFLLGARSDTSLPEYPQALTGLRRNGGNGENGTRPLLEGVERPLCPSVAEAINDLPNIEEYEELNSSDELHIELRRGSQYARILRGEIRDPDDYSYRRRSSANVLTGCQRANHTALSRRRFSETDGGKTESVSRFYKLALDGVSNTLRAGTATDRGAFTSPRPIHPSHPRCISVREAARLHSYPDWFRFHRTIWHGFRQIGNSVPPFLGRAVGAAVAKALGVEPTKPETVLELGPVYLAEFNMKQAANHFGVSPTAIPPRRRMSAASK